MAFGHAIRHQEPFVNDAMSGLRVVAMLEAAEQSLATGSRFIPIDWDRIDALA